jgi:hypothetical protein
MYTQAAERESERRRILSAERRRPITASPFVSPSECDGRAAAYYYLPYMPLLCATRHASRARRAGVPIRRVRIGGRPQGRSPSAVGICAAGTRGAGITRHMPDQEWRAASGIGTLDE